MIAKQLESILSSEGAHTDFQHRSPADLVQRFQSLRGFGLLPRGRGKNAQHLSSKEVIAGVLSIVSDKPGFGGTASKVLMKLRPVGGVDASFFEAETFGSALAKILEDPAAMDTIIEIRVSGSEIYNNGYGRGVITYTGKGGVRTAYFVCDTALSLMGTGAEKTFDPQELISTTIRETVFFRRLFQRIGRKMKIEYPEHAFDHLINPDEEELERQKERRIKCLGVTASSDFLNMPVDTQVTWPKEETVVEFDGKKLILMPRTRDTDTSIHVDLYGQRLSHSEAHTLVNRFLSMLTWCDDQFCTAQEGSSGSRFPVATTKRDLAFVTAHQWVFGRKFPDSEEIKTALALYRQGRNAEQNYLVSYAVLSYVKVIEIRHGKKGEPQKWFEENYPKFASQKNPDANISQFEEACANENQEPYRYIWLACRVAVSHVTKRAPSDPDDFNEIRRLHIAADVIRGLARFFISNELGVSSYPFDGS